MTCFLLKSNQKKNKRFSKKLLFGFFSGFYLIALFFTPPSFAAQLINSIPVQLSENWQVCLHFESEDKQCEIKSLPEKYQVLDSEIQYQSYSKKFVISSELKKLPLGIYFETNDIDKVIVNGENIGQTGKFLPNYETGYRQKRLYYIPNKILKFNQFNSIEIQTYSSRHITSIQFSSPKLGDYLNYQQKIQNTNYLYIVVFTILILLTIFLLFFNFKLKNQSEMLYLVMFLLAYSIITLSRSQIPNEIGLNLNTLLRVEFFMVNISLVGIAIFCFKFFDLEIRKLYTTAISLIGLGALTIILWPNNVQLLSVIKINYWLLCFLSFFIVGNAIYISLLKKRSYSVLMTIILTVSWFVLSYDATILTGHFFGIKVQQNFYFSSVYVAFIGIIITLIITHKYWLLFKGSTYDHLTGSLLRPAFFQRLSEEMQRSKRENSNLLVAVIDIQHVKKVSISYGYNIGNHLLMSVSNSLTQVLKPYDLICRFSDEQFCIASSIRDKAQATKILETIYNELISMQQPINEEVELYIDTKVGGVIYDQELHLSVPLIIQEANYALSKAKSQSKQSYLLEKSLLNQ